MNSPVLRRRVEPRMEAAFFYEMARLIGIQAVAGFAVFGVSCPVSAAAPAAGWPLPGSPPCFRHRCPL